MIQQYGGTPDASRLYGPETEPNGGFAGEAIYNDPTTQQPYLMPSYYSVGPQTVMTPIHELGHVANFAHNLGVFNDLDNTIFDPSNVTSLLQRAFQSQGPSLLNDPVRSILSQLPGLRSMANNFNSYNLLQNHGEIPSTMLEYATSLFNPQDPQVNLLSRAIGMPLWNFFGNQEAPALISGARDVVNAALRAGSSLPQAPTP